MLLLSMKARLSIINVSYQKHKTIVLPRKLQNTGYNVTIGYKGKSEFDEREPRLPNFPMPMAIRVRALENKNCMV